MIFRRRTTDQVYATLQQVQRRITESGAPGGVAPPVGSGSPRPGAPVMRPMQTGPGVGPRPQVAFPTPPPDGPGPFAQMPAVVPAAVPALAPGPLAGPAAFGGGRGSAAGEPTQHGWVVTRSIVITFGLAMVVLMVIVGVLAYHAGAASVAVPGQIPVEPAVAATPSPGADSDAGDAIFVLWQGRVTPADEAKVRKTAAEYNNAAANLGTKPYYDVRQHESGNLQFYFGNLNGRPGIDRKKFNEVVERALAAPKSKGGLGWTGGFWTTVKADAR